MALGRPIWTGQIRLSLVALPVKLYTATESSAKLSFRQIHEPSGKRIRYEKVVPGIGPVDHDKIVRGFEVEKDEYVLLSDEEIDDIKIEARKTLDLVQFVDACEIDPIYFDRPYYVAPDGELAEDAFTVVRDALRRKNRVGLGQIVMRGREYIGALKPCSRGMLLETLHFEDELRKSDPYFAEIGNTTPQEDLVSLAEELIDRKAAPFDAAAFEDNYTSALRDLIEQKLKGKKGRIVAGEDAPKGGGEVVDLMAALKKSLGKRGSKSGASKAGAKAGTSKPNGSKSPSAARKTGTRGRKAA